MAKKPSRMGGILQTITDEDRRTLAVVAICFPIAIIIAVIVLLDACQP